LRNAFLRVIVKLKEEAEKEFRNHLTSPFVTSPNRDNSNKLFLKTATNRGIIISINQDFPLLSNFKSNLKNEQVAILNFILKMCTSLVNSVNQIEKPEFNGDDNVDGIKVDEVRIAILKLLELGIPKETVKSSILANLNINTNNLPIEIGELLD
jgi:hypothetical protein